MAEIEYGTPILCKFLQRCQYHSHYTSSMLDLVSVVKTTSAGNLTEDWENPLRHKPESLDALEQTTYFTKAELKIMYRGFKQCCPNGIVSVHQFREIFQDMFPFSGSSTYAEYVFQTFDQRRSGCLTFQEMVTGISSLTRGPLDIRLEWLFTLYDRKNCGYIDKQDLFQVLGSIYQILGTNHEPKYCRRDLVDHVYLIMQVHDHIVAGNEPTKSLILLFKVY